MIDAGLEPVAKGVLVLATALFVGTPVAAATVVGPVCRSTDLDGETALERTRALLAAISVALAGTVVALVASRLVSSPGGVVGAIRRLAVERPFWLVRLAVATGVAALFARTTSTRRAVRVRRVGAVIAGLLLVGTLAWESHAVRTTGAGGAALYGLHLIGAAVWTAGLVTLAVVVTPVLRGADRARRAAVRVVERFSLVAAAGVTAALSTGLVLAGLQIPSLDALASTAYGAKLGVKVALVAVAAGLGAFTRVVLLRRLRESSRGATADPLAPQSPGGSEIRGDGGRDRAVLSFARAVRLEAVVLLLVVLVSSAPVAPPADAAGAAAAVDAPGAELVGELTPDWQRTTFRLALGGGALGVAAAGTVTVAYEALLFRRYWLPG